jgi:hypothetical protein
MALIGLNKILTNFRSVGNFTNQFIKPCINVIINFTVLNEGVFLLMPIRSILDYFQYDPSD